MEPGDDAARAAVCVAGPTLDGRHAAPAMMASPEAKQQEQEKSGLGWNSHTYVDEVPANPNPHPNPNPNPSPNSYPNLNPDPNPNPNEVPETLVKDDEGNLPDANMEMRRRFEANCRRAQDEICKAVEELDGAKFQQEHRLRG